MSLRSIFDRSRDALYAFATRNPVVERVEDLSVRHDSLGNMTAGSLLGGNDLRTVLFWAAIAMVLLLLGKSTRNGRYAISDEYSCSIEPE
jgi:hypothetical protein